MTDEKKKRTGRCTRNSELVALMLYPLVRDRRMSMIEVSRLLHIKVGELRDIYERNDLTEYLLTDDELDREIEAYGRLLKKKST